MGVVFCPFYNLYDVLPNHADMYLRLDVFIVSRFKALQERVKLHLVFKGITVAKYRLNIGSKEVAMISYRNNSDLVVFIIKSSRSTCAVVTDKMFSYRINEPVGADSVLKNSVLTDALLILHNRALGLLEDTSTPLNYDPLNFLIKKCSEIGDPITNPLE